MNTAANGPPAPVQPRNVGGRHSLFTPELALAIAEQLQAGETQDGAARKLALCKRTVKRWMAKGQADLRCGVRSDYAALVSLCRDARRHRREVLSAGRVGSQLSAPSSIGHVTPETVVVSPLQSPLQPFVGGGAAPRPMVTGEVSDVEDEMRRRYRRSTRGMPEALLAVLREVPPDGCMDGVQLWFDAESAALKDQLDRLAETGINTPAEREEFAELKRRFQELEKLARMVNPR